MIPVKGDTEISAMRKSAEVLVETFREISNTVKSGATTAQLDQVAEKYIRSRGASPAFKGYRGFPASICTSIDSEVVHGIPGSRKLNEGEIVSIDVGVILDGYYSDAAKTYAIGEIDSENADLLDATRKALYRGIRKCRKGNRIGDISHAVQSYVESKGFHVVRALVGHGIGKQLHEEPQIPNFGSPQRGPKIEPGMVFAIEPMINKGISDVLFLDDGWTVVTADGSPSAHFEHTVLVTEGKPEILTLGIEDDGSING